MRYLEKDKDKFSNEKFEYLFTYDKNDILLEKMKLNKKGFCRLKCRYCKKEIDVRKDHKIQLCPKCCCNYENSFAFYVKEELKEDLDEYWDWNKNKENGLNPFLIYKKSDAFKIWIKCKEKQYHGSYLTNCYNFSTGQRCPYCINRKLNYFDSLGFLYHKISKAIVNDKRNNVTYEDMYCIAPHSKKAFYIKCEKCGYKSKKRISLDRLVLRINNGCERCSDGISICEKFIINVLTSINVDFFTQYSPKWAGRKRYDFYIPSENMIIETHGLQHYEEVMKWVNLESQQENDKYKKQLAFNNGIEKYIVIDCRKNSLDWLKDNTFKELKNIFDLNDIDWQNIYLKSLRNNLVESCKMWNLGYGISRIAQEFNLTKETVSRYLKKGKELGICDYNKNESCRRRGR